MSRVFTTGFEFSTAIDNGILSLGSEVSMTSINPRRSAGGNGGVRALDADTTGVNLTTFVPFPYELPESYFRIYFNLDSVPSTHEYIFYDSVGAAEIFKLRITGGTGPLVLSVNGFDVATGTATFIPNTYYSLKIYSLISGAGSIVVDVDNITDISYAGATNGGGTGWNQLRLNTDGRIFYDDLAVNDTYSRINYDGGNGFAPAGTLTGSGPGTATILHHVGDGTTGYMITNTTAGSFSDNDTLSDSGSFTGDVNGDEDFTSTTALAEGFVQLFYPDGVGATTGLTNSAGNMINNFSYVDTFEQITDYVFDSAGGVGDTYTMEDLPAEAVGVNHVDACFYTKKDGATVNNIKSTLRISGTDYDSYEEAIPGSFRWITFSYQENPDTQAPWTISDVDGAEAGPKLET